MAVGADLGCALWSGGGVAPFPFPAGARSATMRVEAMAWHGGLLHLVTPRNRYAWRPGEPEARGQGFPRDPLGVSVELRSIFSTDDRLLEGWDDGVRPDGGPPGAVSWVALPGGTVLCGTVGGVLAEVGGRELRRFVSGPHADPVRHVAWAHGSLWVAASGALHRLDGATWSATPGEPVALLASPDGVLWGLREGRLWRSTGGWPEALGPLLPRPWCLGTSDGDLWIGCHGGVVRRPLG